MQPGSFRYKRMKAADFTPQWYKVCNKGGTAFESPDVPCNWNIARDFFVLDEILVQDRRPCRYTGRRKKAAKDLKRVE